MRDERWRRGNPWAEYMIDHITDETGGGTTVALQRFDRMDKQYRQRGFTGLEL